MGNKTGIASRWMKMSMAARKICRMKVEEAKSFSSIISASDSIDLF